MNLDPLTAAAPGPDLAASSDDHAQLRQLLDVRERQLRGLLTVHALRAECAAWLMRGTDDPDQAAVLRAWLDKVQASGLVREVRLDLASGLQLGRLGPDEPAAGPWRVDLEVPGGLGCLSYLRHSLPHDPAAAQAQASDLLADLAQWLVMRRERDQRLAAQDERQRREAELQALFDAAPVGLALLDPSLTIVRLNRYWAGILGRDPVFALGQPLEAAFPNAGRALVAPVLRGVLATRRPALRRRLDLPVVARDGEVRHVEFSALPLRHADGAVFGLAVVAQDMTDSVRSRDELAGLAARLLRVSEDERRALARDLHDDLGQRLAATKIHLQMAQRAADAGRTMTDAAAAAVATIDQSIGLVRQWAGQLSPAPLDELGLVAALRAHAQEAAGRHGVRIDVHAELPAQALDAGLPVQVFRIVQEALSNALRHGRPERVWIRLAPDASHLRLSVRDNGRGGAPAPHVGMGLLNMRERAELSGGRFELRSGDGQGTEVACAWPLADVGRDAP